MRSSAVGSRQAAMAASIWAWTAGVRVTEAAEVKVGSILRIRMKMN